MKQYDMTLKDILAGLEKSFAKAFLNLDIKTVEALNIEFIKIEEKIADYVCKIEDLSGEVSILHIEFQTENHETMHIRMARYLIELHYRYNLPIIQVVLYLGKGKLIMKDKINFEILDTKIDYKYKIIDIKKIDCEKLLNSNDSDFVVLAILCDFKEKNKSEVVRKILHKIEELNLNDELKKRNQILKLEVLSQLRNLDKVVLKEESMLESIKFDELASVKYGIKKGRLEGKLEGKLEEKIEIIKNSFTLGLDINIIVKLTGLSKKEIEKLKKG